MNNEIIDPSFPNSKAGNRDLHKGNLMFLCRKLLEGFASVIGTGDNLEMRSIAWMLPLLSLAEAGVKREECGNAHLQALRKFQLPLESSFQKKGDLAEVFRLARSACARLDFANTDSNQSLAEKALEDWNHAAAETCQSYFDAEAKEHLFTRGMEGKCNGSIFRSVIASIQSHVKGLRSICEFVRNTQEMDLDGACEEFGAKKSDKIRF